MNIKEKFWKIVDTITSDCPFCAFGRGFVLGFGLTGLGAYALLDLPLFR